MIAAGTTGLIAATPGPARGGVRGHPRAGDGTPEQVHLTWEDSPARTVVVSWVSPGQADRPRVRIGQRVIAATEYARPDGPDGAVSWTYHARVDGLRPGATYGYAVTADNDANAADPFSATFSTAADGRAAFRFTSFGDLAAPQAAYAAGAVEVFQPLFHLLNADLSCAAPASVTTAPDTMPLDTTARDTIAPDPAARERAWRDFGNNVQLSAANRPWLPVPGGYDAGAGRGEPAPGSFLARYALPANAAGGFEGGWYALRVGTVLFVALSGDDVGYAGTPGYSGGAQSRWLEATLAAARGDASIDWVVAAVHPWACSSAPPGSGPELGIRQEWLPVFDRYEVDLVLSGHARGYERSFPVRGFQPGPGGAADAVAGTWHPHPVTQVDSGVFDTSQGTVYLVLGSGGEPAASGVPGLGAGAAPWSARRDSIAGYGIAVFDVDPGTETGGQTSVTVRYYHAGGADPGSPAPGAPGAPADDYTLFETFTLVRPRSDGRRWHPRGLARRRRAASRPRSGGAFRCRRAEHAFSTVMVMNAVDAVVVGAGVIGLTTAISLAEAGLATRVVTAAPPSATTSVAAGAIWGPVRCGPDEQCQAWAGTGLGVLSALAGDPAAGVHQLSGQEVSAFPAKPPAWAGLLPDLRLLGPGELPAGFTSGWRYTAPAVNMPVYLEYLVRRYLGLGGTVSAETVTSLASVAAPVVVNCTGVGARTLVPDPEVVPVRGQVVVVENPGLTEFYLDHGRDDGPDYLYLFPHQDVVILGGTAHEDASDWAPRPEVTERIVRETAAVFPALRGARVVAQRVGLRPCRPAVRLEAETLPGGRVLWHNYGHGGGGVTLSWGCAAELTAGVLAGASR
jgi:glycine/D-amino acid oxidase-like deaminating enzyme